MRSASIMSQGSVRARGAATATTTLDRTEGANSTDHASPGTHLADAAERQPEPVWQTVVWDDPVNLMSYVAYVFRRHFGFDEARSEQLMLQVHNQGRAVVAEGTRTAMELHVEAMHEYGLWATVQQGGTS